MDFFVVFMECRRYVAVKKQWIQNPVIGTESKMFFSNDKEAAPNFQLEQQYYLNERNDACYNVFVRKSFGKSNPFSFQPTTLSPTIFFMQKMNSKQ